jgi:predicted GNAT family acetyltransferase
MRAQEFVKERVKPETAQTGFEHQQLLNNGEWLAKARGDTRDYSGQAANVLHIQILDAKTKEELAWVDFLVKTRREDGEQYLESVYTHVKPSQRGRGLAKAMYQYANSLGNDIQPSQLQTDLGKGMWKGLDKSVRQLPKLPEPEPQPKPTIWQRLRKVVA